MVVGAQEVFRELVLREHLATHGPDSELDIQHLRDTLLFPGGLRCHRVGDHWLASAPFHYPLDDWANKVMRLLRGKGHRHFFDRLTDLYAAMDSRPKASASRQKWILYVGIDLAYPVEDQLRRLQPGLAEARTYLYRFTGKGPPRDKQRTAWRDIYAFVQRDVFGQSTVDIAAELFPREHRVSRATKVRTILAHVRPLARSIRFLPLPSGTCK